MTRILFKAVKEKHTSTASLPCAIFDTCGLVLATISVFKIPRVATSPLPFTSRSSPRNLALLDLDSLLHNATTFIECC